MNNKEVLLKLERSSRDRDFFLLNQENLVKSYGFLERILSSYIDICCTKFKTFTANQTSYIYGSIVTLAVAFVVAKDRYFKNSLGDPIAYMESSMFKVFADEYQTQNIVSEQTQLHMLKGTVAEYRPCLSESYKYCAGKFDKYFPSETPTILKKYFNQIISYCAERKNDGFNVDDVANEVSAAIVSIFKD